MTNPMPKIAKQRLDLLIHERGLAPSREKARAFIMAGEVTVNEQLIDKPGTLVASDAAIVMKSRPRFASRGGEKLDAALEAFPVVVGGLTCADVGASTGGFTDCLLQRGAARVYAIDVGYGQMALPLRDDPRVVMMEKTNARYLESLAEPIALASIDTSFISLRLILPAVKRWLAPQAAIVPLIKPQFEAGHKDVGKGGVIKDAKIHRRVLEEVLTFATSIGMTPRGVIRSPLKGPAGNTEFLTWLTWDADAAPPAPLGDADLNALIAPALDE